MQSVSVNILASAPNLSVAGLSVSPPSGLQSGGTMTVQWSDSNTGLGAATNSFSDQVQIINATTGQTLVTAPVLYDETAQGPLAAGGVAPRQFTFQLPNGAAGAGQLSVVVTNDIYGQVAKFNPDGTPETSSTASVNVTSALATYPDLHVTGLQIDPSSVLEPSGSVVIDWDDSNVGDAQAGGSWNDHVTVLNTSTGQTLISADVSQNAGGVLPTGQSVAETYPLTLPNGNSGVGNLQITVTADSGNNLPEFNADGTPDTNRSATISLRSRYWLPPPTSS